MTSSMEATLGRWKTEQAHIRNELTFLDSASFTVSSTASREPPLSSDHLAAEYDTPTVHIDRPEDLVVRDLGFIGGVDISFLPTASPASPLTDDPPQQGVATVLVLAFPSLELVRTVSRRIVLREPYISSFLAFREAPPLLDLIADLRADLEREGKFDEFPQVLFVDGNGRLHERECGLACVLGLRLGIPTIGISKKPYIFSDSPSGAQSAVHWRSTPRSLEAVLKTRLLTRGSWVGLFPPPSPPAEQSSALSSGRSVLLDHSSPYYGAAVVPSASSRTAVFVSAGHRVSLETCVRLTVLCSKTKIPEPVRRADLEGREQVREWVEERRRAGRHHPKERRD